MPERITIQTLDEVTIIGDWVTTPTMIGAVLCLHSMRTDRTAWKALQQTLSRHGVASLAIDLRGHGESTRGPGGSLLSAATFSDDEMQESTFDVIAGCEWLHRRGIALRSIALCGASIGANLALRMLMEEPELAGAALLSPGRDYHGMNVVQDIDRIVPQQAIWIAASEGDDTESFDASKEAYGVAWCDQKQWVPLKRAGHGTEMLETQPQLLPQLAEWLMKTVQGV